MFSVNVECFTLSFVDVYINGFKNLSPTPNPCFLLHLPAIMNITKLSNFVCVKSALIRSYSGQHLRHISPYSLQMRENTDQIRIRFTLCLSNFISFPDTSSCDGNSWIFCGEYWGHSSLFSVSADFPFCSEIPKEYMWTE